MLSIYYSLCKDGTNLSEKVMRLDQNPVFRNVIVPWYDSETACLIVIIFMGIVVLFGFVGISVAQNNRIYQEHLWVPILLIVMSCSVILSIAIRLTKRYSQRFSK